MWNEFWALCARSTTLFGEVQLVGNNWSKRTFSTISRDPVELEPPFMHRTILFSFNIPWRGILRSSCCTASRQLTVRRCNHPQSKHRLQATQISKLFWKYRKWRNEEFEIPKYRIQESPGWDSESTILVELETLLDLEPWTCGEWNVALPTATPQFLTDDARTKE